MAYSTDLRLRVVEAVRQEGITQEEAGRRFRVAAGTVSVWLKKHREGDLTPGKPGPTGSRTLSESDLEDLQKWVRERPGITSQEAAVKLGHKVTAGYIRRLWVRSGLSFKKN